MKGISLTTSMWSNLLSLQNISGQVSSTQNKLATGNKVNSAIDSPSSYYTALSLNNRADDLNALLDSMGQAVSTIKAATTALENAADFLEQASAVATQALETAKVPSKSFFEEKVGKNGAVVTTAQELRDAIDAGKETICVYGAIDLDDISTTGGIRLKENQKLVGIGYFGNYDTDTDKFSSLSASSKVKQNMIQVNQNDIIISDLSVSYKNYTTSGSTHVIAFDGGGNINQRQITLQNLDIKGSFVKNKEDSANNGGIYSGNKATTNIKGKINIEMSGYFGCGIYSNASIANIEDNTQITIKTQGVNGHGIISQANSTLNIASQAQIVLDLKGTTAYGLYQMIDSVANIAGKVKINTAQGAAIINCSLSGNTTNITSSAQIYFSSTGSIAPIYNGSDTRNSPNILDIAAGAKLAFEKDGKTDWYEVKENYKDENKSTTTNNTITADNVKDKLNVEETSAWDLPEKVKEKEDEEGLALDVGETNIQYQEIINQYDALIKDASYKGINLLQTDKLSVKFNEDNTASLNVQGKDMSSQALGFTVFGWETQGDIAQSLSEIARALKSIRNYSAELGNNYSIITTRQDFTESLINVLTEGADKLTLADMNEESANMLALQTRQQLAINSLSLASQASQSILKLF